MYFWKIEKLKDDIKAGNFNESDRFIYAFIYVTLTAIFMEAMSRMPVENPNIWDSLDSITNIIIIIVGTFFAYKVNGGANGTDFLGRFFSVSFVVSIRFMVLLIPMFMALVAFYIYAYPEEETVASTPMDTIPFVIWFAFLYVRVCKHISDIKNS